MDEQYLLATARYIEHNPVRAGIAEKPEDYRWSSARAHLCGVDDPLVSVAPLLEIVGNWQRFINNEGHEKDRESIRLHTKTGRPLGSEKFMSEIEEQTGRVLQKRKPGPKPVTESH